jgi:hypothetical protein
VNDHEAAEHYVTMAKAARYDELVGILTDVASSEDAAQAIQRMGAMQAKFTEWTDKPL